MEPVSIGLGALIWKVAVEPVINSYQDGYGDMIKDGINNALTKVFEKLPFKKNELEIIEAEIIEADVEVLKDKEKFLEFMQNNTQIKELIHGVSQREPNINVVIEKSYNEILIDGSNNSIVF